MRISDWSSDVCSSDLTGRSAVPYLLKARPYGFICSDGGMARDRSGVLGLDAANEEGLPGATVDARSAAMGDGLSSYNDGTISACNALAAAAGVRVACRRVKRHSIYLTVERFSAIQR